MGLCWRFPRLFRDRGRIRVSSGAGLREQGFLDDHQVGEGEQGMEVHRIFGQPPIPHHGMTPLPLDYSERKLNDGPQRSDHLVLQRRLQAQFLAVGGVLAET